VERGMGDDHEDGSQRRVPNSMFDHEMGAACIVTTQSATQALTPPPCILYGSIQPASIQPAQVCTSSTLPPAAALPNRRRARVPIPASAMQKPDLLPTPSWHKLSTQICSCTFPASHKSIMHIVPAESQTRPRSHHRHHAVIRISHRLDIRMRHRIELVELQLVVRLDIDVRALVLR